MRTLEFSDAEKAIAAGVAEARSRGLTLAFAVTDHAGQLISCARMDGAPARLLRHATRKAFTAAEMGRNTLSFGEDLRERGGNLAQWGNPDLTTLPGGLVAKADGEVLGAVACGGGRLADDEEVAEVMLRAIGVTPVVDERLSRG